MNNLLKAELLSLISTKKVLRKKKKLIRNKQFVSHWLSAFFISTMLGLTSTTYAAVKVPPTIATVTSGINTQDLAGDLASTCASGTFALTNTFNTQQFIVDRGIQLNWNQRRNLGTAIKLTSTTAGSSLLNTLEFGISGPNPQTDKEIRKQDVQVSWSLGGTGILSDPMNQVTSHADGAIINSGDLLSLSTSRYSSSEWLVTVPLGDVSGSIVVDFVSSNGPGVFNDHEGFWFDTALSCDTDGDGIPDHLEIKAIPTLSEWSLMLLMLLLGFVGYRQATLRGGVRF